MISGTRKPPPISTSSPRDTTTVAAARERAEREQHRRRVVVDDDPGLGAARTREQRAGVVVPRPALAGRPDRYSRFEYAPPTRAAVGRVASAPSGARPRLVCSSTPVAFTTGRSRAPCSRSTRRAASRTTASSSTSPPVDDRHPGVRDRVTRSIGEQRVGEAGEPAHDPVDRGKGTPGVHRPTYNMKVKVCARSPYGREWD